MFLDKVRHIVLFLFVVLLFSCGDSGSENTVRPAIVAKGEKADKTLLVYMMAENSLCGFVSDDIVEIRKAVARIPNDCRLFVYVDDKAAPVLSQYFGLSDGSVGKEDYHPFSADVCSSDTASLGKVLDFILNDYPTESLDLVLWSHGDGWLRGPLKTASQRSIGIDNGKNTADDNVTETIEIEELASLLERLPLKVNRLLFDACFMQCAESSYALRNVVEWIIASPAEIPGTGAPYDIVVPEFFISDKPEGIIDAYIVGYENRRVGAVLSAVRASEMQRLADATYANVIKYFNVDRKRDYDGVFSYLPGGKYNDSKAYPSYFDMNAVMQRFLSKDDYLRWHEVYESAVSYILSSPEWYSELCGRSIEYDDVKGGGMSVYMPQNSSYNEKFNSDFVTTEWYSAAGWREAGW